MSVESPVGAGGRKESEAGDPADRERIPESSGPDPASSAQAGASTEGGAPPRAAGDPAGSRESGGGLPETWRILPLAVATFLLYLALERLPLSGGFIGVLGAVVGVFAPAPAIQVFLRWGVRFGTLTLLAVAFALGLTGGWQSALHFLVSIGAIVWMLSTAILSGRSADKAVLWGVLGAAVGVGVLYGVDVLRGSGEVLAPLLQPEAEEGMRQLPGAAAGIDREEFNQLVRVIGRLMPAVAIMQATLLSLLNYMLVRRLWTLRGAGGLFPRGDLGRWSVPEPAIWALIASGVAVFFLPGGALFWLAANLLLILAFGYFLQGLAIFHFLFRRFAVAVFLRIPLYFIAGMFSYAVAAFGLFDLWFDFRKIRTAGPSPDSPRDGGGG